MEQAKEGWYFQNVISNRELALSGFRYKNETKHYKIIKSFTRYQTTDIILYVVNGNVCSFHFFVELHLCFYKCQQTVL